MRKATDYGVNCREIRRNSAPAAILLQLLSILDNNPVVCYINVCYAIVYLNCKLLGKKKKGENIL